MLLSVKTLKVYRFYILKLTVQFWSENWMFPFLFLSRDGNYGLICLVSITMGA